MPLATGTRLGCYEILSPLGAGGMGEVFRARDTKLHRDVALKILPALFGLDPDRLARFTREAQVLASLNHPNIAAIHGFEDSTEPPALVLELVEGPTLAERIARGPLPLDEAVPIARQICDALEAAHDQGIIHRDLKPANIKVRPDGTVKVLDFGLAKALETPAAERKDATTSPTITSPALTRMGLIMGTASYMSPEQANGHAADKRSDVWSFGCVLYEMLTGRRTFDGEGVSDTLASVLKSDPDWRALPPALPPPIRALVEGSLKRDRRERIGDISTARFLLNQPAAAIPAEARAPSPRARVWQRAGLLAIGAALGAAAMAGLWRSQKPAAAPITRFSAMLPQGQQFSLPRQAVTISPDGTRIVYAVDDRLFLKVLAEPEPRVLAGADRAMTPVFSPDSQSVAFWADSMLKRIAIGGGVPVPICRTGPAPSALSWYESGILFSVAGTGIMRVSPTGSAKPDVLVPLSTADGLAHGPRLLPDGKTLLYTLTTDTGIGSSGDRWNSAKIIVQSLETGARKTIIEPGTDARYVPTGHIVYALGGTVFATGFNLATLETTGGPAPVVEEVQRVLAVDSGSSHFAFSDTGSLVYIAGTATSGIQQLYLFDYNGARQPLTLPPGSYNFPRVSPNGLLLAFQSTDAKGEPFIATYDLSGGKQARRLTFGSSNRFPIWSGDGKYVVYQSDRDGDAAVFRQSVDGGAPERLTKPGPGATHVPEAWLPKGDVLLFSEAKEKSTSLWRLSLSERKVAPFGGVPSTLIPTNAAFSPDGRWVAYQAGDILFGEGSVFVEPFPPNGSKHQIATGGRPVWSLDGKRLFYIPGPNRLNAVSVSTHPGFSFTEPVSVPRGFSVSGPLSPRAYDVTDKGRIIGFAAPLTQAGLFTTPGPVELRFVLNWFEELKARAPLK